MPSGGYRRCAATTDSDRTSAPVTTGGDKSTKIVRNVLRFLLTTAWTVYILFSGLDCTTRVWRVLLFLEFKTIWRRQRSQLIGGSWLGRNHVSTHFVLGLTSDDPLTSAKNNDNQLLITSWNRRCFMIIFIHQYMVGNNKHSTPHCRVLPPGEFNVVIPQPLSVYSESFLTISDKNLEKNDDSGTRSSHSDVGFIHCTMTINALWDPVHLQIIIINNK